MSLLRWQCKDNHRGQDRVAPKKSHLPAARGQRRSTVGSSFTVKHFSSFDSARHSTRFRNALPDLAWGSRRVGCLGYGWKPQRLAFLPSMRDSASCRRGKRSSCMYSPFRFRSWTIFSFARAFSISPSLK
jgi:hypothetical protein